MTAFIHALRRFWGDQVHLQQLYRDRYDITGAEAVEAMRRLRWSGDRLLGDWIQLPR